jgi:NAD+ kinase
MRNLGIVANCAKQRAADVLARILRKSSELNMTLLADPATAELLPALAVADIPDLFERVDAVMALGGDGTMLRVVREINGRDRPVIGVNIGSLGFLTSVSEDELGEGLECLALDRFVVSEWAVAQCEVMRGGVVTATYRALNDVVVGNGPSNRVITLDVRVGGDYVTSYVCDGLIVTTPAGSTGHSLSAGGPIVTPRSPVFVLSLICPHTLSSRPVVIPDTTPIEVVPAGDSVQAVLSVDGQVGQALAAGDSVRIRRGEVGARFVHLPGYSYFGVLRQKLRWSGSSV